ncbi:hypothetical protein [Lactobacillus crispatus]|jgi:hypothetical protein|uniref:DUF1828 domain-containing protein n=1 Tax=Lactobacillus crispatus TaxID=47770 RepID=A0ABV2BCU4_9LACO|nr:hypothetical protein [Lactobacillus crispatus]MCI7335797.1 hypothetical protein [Lactobacillus amylovorus]TDM96368.1 hypothetical protein CEE88_11700 [Lactobacillus crispatus]
MKQMNIENTVQHFKNRIDNLKKVNQIDLNEPVVLNFTVIPDDDDNYVGYITLDVYNVIIKDTTQLKAPFFKSKTFNEQVDDLMIQRYKSLSKSDSELFQRLIALLKDEGFKSLYVSNASMEHMNFEVIDL